MNVATSKPPPPIPMRDVFKVCEEADAAIKREPGVE